MASYDTAFTSFQAQYPAYKKTSYLDRLRSEDYSRIDDQDHVYLDYTGGSLYGASQVREHLEFLNTHILGNPHSNNPSSQRMTDYVERTRDAILDFFSAPQEEYTAIFTQNASGALKLVGEAYPFGEDSRYILPYDNHNSVNGIREFARSRGAEIQYIPVTMPDLTLDHRKMRAAFDTLKKGFHHLVAYPAQSNFSGVQHSFEWIEKAHANGADVLLDAAAFVPTNHLNLSKIHPDFVAISFYKMFGYPTGVGCLIARRDTLHKLRRPWFAGGTITLASVQAMEHRLAENEAGFEDGTINYLNIPAVETGLHHLQSISMDTIHNRVKCLTDWLLKTLLEMRHTNGNPLVRIYGPVTTANRGGTVSFNLYDPEGTLIDFRRVEELANKENISLRTGCFCNPGVNEIAEELTAEEMSAGFSKTPDFDYPHFLSLLEHQQGKSAGAVRVSTGIVSNFRDVYRFTGFIESFLNQSSQKIGQVKFDIRTCRRLRDGS